MALVLNAQEVMGFLDEVFPQVREDFAIDALDTESCTMRLLTAERHLRPGGTVSGPSLFSLADVSVYVMVLARIGRQALAVTSNAHIDFLRKPESGRDVVAQCRLVKLGRVLAVGEVHMFSEGSDRMVARASLTYAIPQK